MSTSVMLVSSSALFISALARKSIEVFSNHFNVIVVCPYSSVVEDLCHQTNAIFEPIEIKRKPSPVRDIQAIFKLRSVVIKTSPNVVLSYNAKGGLICGIVASLVRKPKYVHNFTGLIGPYASGIARYIYKTTEFLTLNGVDLAIAESKGVKRQLLPLARKPSKLVLLGDGNMSGVNVEKFKPVSLTKRSELRKGWDVRSNQRIALYIGRINPDKGILPMIEAVNLVRQDWGELKLWIVGGLDDNDEYNQSFQKAIRGHEWIRFFDFQTGIERFLQAADFLILPTLREGFPNVVLESLACGLPVLVTDVPGVEETVRATGFGTVVPSNKQADITKGLLQIKTQLLILDKIDQKRAIDLIRQRYDQHLVINRYMRLIKELASNQSIDDGKVARLSKSTEVSSQGE